MWEFKNISPQAKAKTIINVYGEGMSEIIMKREKTLVVWKIVISSGFAILYGILNMSNPSVTTQTDMQFCKPKTWLVSRINTKSYLEKRK